MKSLADVLDVVDPRPVEKIPANDFEQLVDITDAVDFCQKVVQTREFRQYIMNGIVLGDLPPAVVCRVIDHAWGKPVERVEHTGKDGQPIVTEVRRVIVRASALDFGDEPVSEKSNITH